MSRWLVETGKEEPSVVANIEGQRSKLTKQLDEQRERIDQRYEELQAILMHGQVFEVTCEDLGKKLKGLESKVGALRPVSAIYETVKIQEIDAEGIREDVEKYEPIYEKVMDEGEKLVEETSPGEEKDLLVEKLSDLITRWSGLKAKTDAYENILEKTSPLAKNYDIIKTPFVDWISATEANLDSIDPTTLRKDEVREFGQELENLQNEVDAHAREFDGVQRSGKDVMAAADEDKKVIDTELGNTGKRWLELRKRLESTKEELEKREKCLEDYEDRVNIIEEIFASCEPALAERKSYGLSDEGRKRDVTKIDELLNVLEERRPVAEELSKVYEELTNAVDENDPEAAVMNEKVNEIYAKYQELPEKLKLKKATLEKEVEYISKLNTTCRNLETSVPKVAQEFSNQSPVSTKPAVIKEQLTANEVIGKEIEKCRDELGDMEDCGKWLVENLSSDPRIIREVHERIEKAREPVDGLAAKVNQRQNQLETAALQAQEFTEYFEEFSMKIAAMEDEMGSLQAVSGVYRYELRT